VLFFAGTFLLLRSVMLQLLAFDPTQRLSAEATLKILSRRSQHSPADRRDLSLPPCETVAMLSTLNLEGDTSSTSSDFWRLETFLQVSDVSSVQSMRHDELTWKNELYDC
jgi:hypothetical protein